MNSQAFLKEMNSQAFLKEMNSQAFLSQEFLVKEFSYFQKTSEFPKFNN